MKILLLIGLLAVWPSTVRAEPQVYKDDVIEITFPGPFSSETKDISMPAGKTQITFLHCKFGTISYDINVSDLPEGSSISMEGAVEAARKQAGGLLKSFEKQQNPKIQMIGCEYVMDAGVGTHRGVIFVIGHRYYSLGYTGPIASENTKAANRFFNSLKFFGHQIAE